MNTATLDMTHSGVGPLIQQNLMAYMRLFAGLPGVAQRDDDAFWSIYPPGAPGSIVLRACWPAQGVEAAIDQLFTEVGRHVDGIDWLTFPGDAPPDLRARLRARGLPEGTGGNWLWADLTALPPAPPTPEGFSVEHVRDDAGLRVWVEASEAGFQGSLGIFYDAYARHGYGPAAQSHHYLGRVGQQVVTSATVLEAGGTASLYDISTPPEHRRHGYGGAITRALMDHLRGRGHHQTWIWSSDLGRSVYQSLGYRDADFGVREFQWRRAA